MANRTPTSITEAISKFLSIKMKHRLAIKRAYDDWTFKQIFHDRKQLQIIRYQSLDLMEHQRYGSDLAAAKFVLKFAGGRIRNERDKWISKVQDMPQDYTKSFKLTALQINNSELATEGIDNFVGLDHLEWLDLSNNKRLDDFACDMLGKQFRLSKTLNEIHLSFNPRISIYGIEALFKIPSIKKIVAIETAACEHDEVDSFVLAAEDERDCDVFLHKNGRKFKLDDLENLRLDINPKLASN